MTEHAYRQLKPDLQSLRHPGEQLVGIALGIFCVLLWGLLASPITLVGFSGWLGFLVALLIVGLIFVVIEQLLRVQLYGNMMLLSTEQHPELAAIVLTQSQQLGLVQPPAVFLVNSHGLMNALALATLSRRAVILNSALVDFYLEQDQPDQLKAVVARELAHHALGHTKNWWNILIAVSNPLFLLMMTYLVMVFGVTLLAGAFVVDRDAGAGLFLAGLGLVSFPLVGFVVFLIRQAYRRICELSCDRVAADLIQDDLAAGCTARALLGLVAGSTVLAPTNQLSPFVTQQYFANPFFTWVTELLSEYPLMTKRLSQLQEFLRHPAAPLTT